MSNRVFAKLCKPRITKFAPTLVGQSVPRRGTDNSAKTGNFIDQLVKNWAGASVGSSTVDIENFGIEIKSKDTESDSDWTIGSMTLDDIISTPYTDSSIYQKLQALFLVEYNNSLSIITSANLYYLDNDDIQTLIQAGYEAARQEMISNCLCSPTKEQLFDFGEKISHNYQKYQRVSGTTGFGFERGLSNNSFHFRITTRCMRKLVKLSVANNNSCFVF